MSDRARQLVRAFELEPQSRAAFKAVRKMGPADAMYVPVNGLMSLIVGYLAIDRSFRMLQLAPAIAIAAAVVALLGLRMWGVVNMAREIPRELRQWRRYADDVGRTPFFRKLGRAQRPRRVRLPANTVLESAATCHCDSLNFLFGDLAARYAWLHLAPRAGAGPHLKEFV